MSIQSFESYAELTQLNVPFRPVTAAPTEPFDLPPASGSCCVRTRRIVLVSPSPARLHELVRDLSSTCFDVISLHRFDPELIRELKPELVLADLTGRDPQADWQAITQGSDTAASELNRLPHRYLVTAGAPRLALARDRELPWPAPTRELAARLQLELEHNPASPAGEAEPQYRFKDLTIDRRKQAVYRNGVRLVLTKTEYDLLVAVVEAKGETLTREQILDAVWGTDYYGGSNVVDVHVRSLRSKLGDRAVYSRYVSTVRGVGYRLAD